MFKNNKWKLIISSVIILLPIAVGLILWDKLPEQMTTHWGIDGNADGFSAPVIAVLVLPVFLLLMHLFCLFLTSKDPKNEYQNSKAFGIVFWIMPVISLFSNAMIYSTAFGKEINPTLLMPVFLGLMFIVIGNYMPKFKQNYTMGIKIKWTLENEENWNATHRFAGKIWVLGGVSILFLAFLPVTIMFVSFFILMLPMIIIPVCYSYSYHKKQLENGTADTDSQPTFKYPKKIKIISLVSVTIILILVTFIMFIGNVTVEYNENSFTVDANFWNELTVDYEAIDTIDYRENLDRGVRTSGFNSARLLLGNFENEEFGSYTLYSYTSCDSAVVLKVQGKILVINGSTAKETKEIYTELIKVKQ